MRRVAGAVAVALAVAVVSWFVVAVDASGCLAVPMVPVELGKILYVQFYVRNEACRILRAKNRGYNPGFLKKPGL